MAATGIGFRWLDILEKEFDKACIELDTSLADIEVEEAEATYTARQKIASLSSCFAQLSHKAQTIFQNSAKLEAELVDMRAELVEARAAAAAHEERNGPALTTGRGALEAARTRVEAAQLARENAGLRDTILALHADLYSARLAAKYLDKELAGRIQQLQLLGREMRSELRDSLWRQLEAEILLQRHKTVVRACRSGKPCGPAPAADARGVGRPRLVRVKRDPHQGLGISITGGREHGVPILISELEAGGPAALTRALHVGDAILAVNDVDLMQACHKEAVTALQSATGDCALFVQFVACDDDDRLADDNHYRFPLYPDDEDVFVPEPNGSGATPTAPRTPEYNNRANSDGGNSCSEYESPPYPTAPPAALTHYVDSNLYNAINNNLSILDMDDESIQIETETGAVISPPQSPAMRDRTPPRYQRHLGRYRGISADISSADSPHSTPVHARRPHIKKKKVKPGDWRVKGAYRAIDGGQSSDEEVSPTPPLDNVPAVTEMESPNMSTPPKQNETPESQLSPTSDLSPVTKETPVYPRLSPPASHLVKKIDTATKVTDDEESWKKKAFRIGSARRVSDTPHPITNGDRPKSPVVIKRMSTLLSGDGDPDFGTPV